VVLSSGNELSQLQPKSTYVPLNSIYPQTKIAFRVSLLKFQYPCWTDFVPRLIMEQGTSYGTCQAYQ
jgi:hypothetical protein